MISCIFTELKGDEGWCQFNYAKSFSLAASTVKDNCPRISYLEVDEKTFVEHYESPGQPVVIVDSQLEWQASQKWTLEVCVGRKIILTIKYKNGIKHLKH